MIKVAWLCYYNINLLLPEIELDRQMGMHSGSWIQNLSSGLIENPNVELHIITHSPIVKKTQSINKFGIHFHVIKYAIPFTSRGFPWYLPIDKLTRYASFTKAAGEIINKIEPHVLHVHGTEGAYCFPAFKTKIPSLISIQGIMAEVIKIDPTILGYMQVQLEKYAIRKGKNFGCRTSFDTGFIRENNKNARIFDLPEAMNKVFFEQQWQPEPGLSLLFVGSVTKRKGIGDLIDALHKLKIYFPEIRLTIIGSGNRENIEFLNNLIEKLDLKSNVKWIGSRSPDEIAKELSKTTLFVLPTLMDNSPNCLVEAMAVGVPSIATRVGGIPSMIDDNEDGIMFEKHDVDGLVEIVRTLASDKELQNKLSRNARAKARQRNYPANVAEIYMKAYKELIS